MSTIFRTCFFVLSVLLGTTLAACAAPVAETADPANPPPALAAEGVAPPQGPREEAPPLQPLHRFLQAEEALSRGDKAGAAQIYGALVQWAASNPFGEWMGGSGVASVALWRSASLLGQDPSPDGEAIDALLKSALVLRPSPLVTGMSQPSLLGSLPHLETERDRLLIRLAWGAGRGEEALKLFQAVLPDACRWEWQGAEKALWERSTAPGEASRGEAFLARGACHGRRGQVQEAVLWLQKARQEADPEIRARAGLELARLKASRMASKQDHRETAELLASAAREATDAETAQTALYRLAYLSRQAPGRDTRRFLEGLRDLIRKHPQGVLADDALYRLALHYEDAGRLDEALDHYERLREFQGPNDWLNMGAFKPAMALYARGARGDVPQAMAILEEVAERRPWGPLHGAALFWLGRMSEEADDEEKARACFRRLVEEAPYSYHGLRARMHLVHGPAAKALLGPDAETRKALKSALAREKPEGPLPFPSPYHRRVAQALETGLYGQALHSLHSLREAFPSRRLEDLSLEELDRTGLLGPVSVLLALRQDVIAALNRFPDPRNRLDLARRVGRDGGDWPLSMYLATGAHASPESRAEAQRQPGYLSAAYPVVFRKALMEQSARYEVPAALLYAVMRNESLFNPDALSVDKALGLFQFIPSTFDALDRRWKLLQGSGAPSREAFLLDPERSIGLGARWLREELLQRQDGRIPFAVMEHNAGYPAVKGWIARWTQQDRLRDLEYMIETVPYLETRIFTRRVIRDWLVVEGLGLF